MRHQSSRRFCNAAVAFLGLSCTGAAAGATVPDAVSFLTASQSPDVCDRSWRVVTSYPSKSAPGT